MKITLYQYEMCPFCARVRAKLDELGLDYEKVNVSPDPNEERRAQVIEQSGCKTVPVVHITTDEGDALWMGESGDIIAWLDDHA